MDAKWEAAIDLTLRRLVYGSLAGGAAGLVLFRASPRRARPLASRRTKKSLRIGVHHANGVVWEAVSPSPRLAERPIARAIPGSRPHHTGSHTTAFAW